MIFWANSRRDLEFKTRLKVGFEQSKALQDYQTLASVVSQALGGKADKESGGGKAARQEAEKGTVFRPQSAEEMKLAFGAVFGNGR